MIQESFHGTLEPPPPDDLLFLHVAAADIPKRTRDGRLWDEGGSGAPDPFVIVFVDESLALIELKQRAMQLPNLGVDFTQTDFAAVASGFGGIGVTANSRDELAGALKNALTEKEKFTVIACPIPRKNYDGKI